MNATEILQAQGDFAAKWSYKNDPVIPGFTKVASTLDMNDPVVTDSGYYGAVYRKDGTNELFIMHRGTEPTELADIRNDFNILTGQALEQFEALDRFIIYLAQEKGIQARIWTQ